MAMKHKKAKAVKAAPTKATKKATGKKSGKAPKPSRQVATVKSTQGISSRTSSARKAAVSSKKASLKKQQSRSTHTRRRPIATATSRKRPATRVATPVKATKGKKMTLQPANTIAKTTRSASQSAKRSTVKPLSPPHPDPTPLALPTPPLITPVLQVASEME